MASTKKRKGNSASKKKPEKSKENCAEATAGGPRKSPVVLVADPPLFDSTAESLPPKPDPPSEETRIESAPLLKVSALVPATDVLVAPVAVKAAAATSTDGFPVHSSGELPPLRTGARLRVVKGAKPLGLWRDIRKPVLQALANWLVFAIVIVFVFLILWFWIGLEKAKTSVGVVLTGSWGPTEILGEWMKKEPDPAVIRFLLPLKEGSHSVAGTSIRVKFRFLGEPDEPEPKHFKSLEVIHEGLLQDTVLFETRDGLIVYSKSEGPSADRLTNCEVLAEWFVPRVTTASTVQRGDSLVMVIAIRSLNPGKDDCPAMSVAQ